jgi:phage tail sheath protein FI
MAFQHGVYVGEIPTSVTPPAQTTAGLPVVFGTAPLHLASDPAKANRPVLCNTYAETVQQFGYSDDWAKYTLCEAMYSQFSLYNCAPVVFVNVLDPSKHKKTTTKATLTISQGRAVVDDPVMLDTLKVYKTEAAQPAVRGTDYEAAYDDDDKLVISIISTGALKDSSTVYADYDALDPSAVKATDIIGGVDASTGALKGLECISQVFPLTRLVPGLILAPGWSDNTEVAAVMAAKASKINGLFQAIALVDLPADSSLNKYTDVPSYKEKNNFTSTLEYVCWPRVSLGGKIYHLSTHVLGAIATADAANDDVPSYSPSNHTIQADGLCLADGTEVVLDNEQAVYLNGQGVGTGLNFTGGWRLFGNRMACYPTDTDPKDAFINIRRMFNWQAQTFILTYWQQLDRNITWRLIQSITDSEQIRLNAFVASQDILGFSIEARREENPTTELMNGHIVFHQMFTPPPPAEKIDNKLEYSSSYLAALFA